NRRLSCGFPRQSNGCGRVGRNPFSAACKAELFAGSRLYGHPVDRQSDNLRNTLAHSVAVGSDARGLADKRDVKMRQLAAACLHAFEGEREELVRAGAAPARIAGREMHSDIA